MNRTVSNLIFLSVLSCFGGGKKSIFKKLKVKFFLLTFTREIPLLVIRQFFYSRSVIIFKMVEGDIVVGGVFQEYPVFVVF